MLQDYDPSELIAKLARSAGIDAADLEEAEGELTAFAAAVVEMCAGEVERLALERQAQGYGDALRFSAEAATLLRAIIPQP